MDRVARTDTLVSMEEQCLIGGCERPVYARGLCATCYQRLRYQKRLDEVTPEVPERPCVHCGVTFRPKTLKSNAEYCSRKCIDSARTARRRAAYRPEHIGCLQCGRDMLKKRADARFCSEACGNVWHNRQRAIERGTERALAQPPCRACGGVVQPPRRIFCSPECKRTARQPGGYGLSTDEFSQLLERQVNACAICHTPSWGPKGPQIDHDHETGAVRGVLCLNCNNGLGRFMDNTAFLRSAVAYLERHAVT